MTNPSRTRALEAWCRDRLDAPVRLTPMPVEASTRQFHRARLADGRTFVAMDAPPETEDNAQFVRLSGLFRAHDVHVPEVIAFDAARGFLIVTDLGERLFQRAYAEGQRDAALAGALETLLRIQSIDSELIPVYAVQRFYDELATFTEWLVEGFLGLPLPPFLAATWDALVEATQAQPQVTVHRDYHSRNLLLLDDGAVGVVDFQDALRGPVTYDLASLLEDCYVEFEPALVAAWQQRFVARARPEIDDFGRAFDFTTVQRQLKAAGIFARLKLRDGRASHLADIPPVLGRIAGRAARHPELAALADWLNATVRPAADRVIQ